MSTRLWGYLCVVGPHASNLLLSSLSRLVRSVLHMPSAQGSGSSGRGGALCDPGLKNMGTCCTSGFPKRQAGLSYAIAPEHGAG